jgi:hypothetical protein
MNIVLWVIQVMLALHTVMGAVWKFSNAESAVPSLGAMPHALWMTLAALEILFAIALVLPAFLKRWAILAPVAACGIALEMLFFTVMHFLSGATAHGEVIYWLVVAAICAFVAYGRRSRA